MFPFFQRRIKTKYLSIRFPKYGLVGEVLKATPFEKYRNQNLYAFSTYHLLYEHMENFISISKFIHCLKYSEIRREYSQ